MRKPSTYSLKAEEDSDYSTSAAVSTQAYLDDTISPQDSYNKEHSDDSDCFSDSSKKIRKKRQAYQKISDDIRMKLLECVKNGETLKSAAKRFKINYSSAKSILHTFRKEGRILKKSAQERTIKKKSDSLIDVETTPKSAKMSKKNSINLPTENVRTSKSLNNLSGKPYSKESTPAGSLTRLDEGSYENHNYHHMDHEANYADQYVQRQPRMGHDDSQHHYNKVNYTMNYNDSMAHHHHDAPRTYIHGESLEHNNYGMAYPRGGEFESFNDMVSALQHRPVQVDDFFSESINGYLQQREQNTYHAEDRFFKTEHGHDYNDKTENGYNTLQSFMDTQSMFRDAMKRANHVSYSNSNNAGMRKSSIDLF